jgi:hypothetical protein
VLLPGIRHHRLPRRGKIFPLIDIRQPRNGDRLVTVEADERRIDKSTTSITPGMASTSRPDRAQISVRVAAGSTAWT